MNRARRIVIAKLTGILVAAPLLLLAFSGGPDPGHTGAPGEQTCIACHTGTSLNGGPGRVQIGFPAETYAPQARHRITITVSDPNQSRWGFQLSARRADLAQAGNFAIVDATATQIICQDRRAAPCRPESPIEYAEHTLAGTRPGTRNSVTFEVDWTAPSADAGPVTFYVAANAANGDNTNFGDRIYTANLAVQPGAEPGQRPTISQNGVVNGASFQPSIAAGSWFTVQGTNLSVETRTLDFQDGRYPTEAHGVRVTVNGRPAYLQYVSPGQLNALVPDDESVGPVQVAVTLNGNTSDALTVQMERFSPAFFAWPQNQPVATDPQFNWKVKSGTFQGVNTTPAAPGDVIILWGTGFGPTSPQVEAGRQVSGAPTLVDAPTITVGGVTAEYLGGALSPGFTGLYQIAIRVPATLQNGDHPVIASIGSFRSPETLLLTVQRP
jgi:uncharacterized protein (TIGR03437 family)